MKTSNRKFVLIVITVAVFISQNFLNCKSSEKEYFNLNYKPSKGIIKFTEGKFTFLTDSQSINSIIEFYSNRAYKNQISQLINNSFSKSVNDTIQFNSFKIPFNIGNDKSYLYWYSKDIIPALMSQNKIAVIDKNKKLVGRIFSEKIGSKKNGEIRRTYFDDNSKKEIISFIIYKKTIFNDRKYFDENIILDTL